MAVKIIYTDIALGAAENAVVSVTDAEPFSTPYLIPFGASTGAVATFEHNSWGLSNDYKIKDKQRFALWTKSISNSAGVLDTPAIITLDFSQQYTATGLTIQFSPDANEYCSKISVVWYQGETIRASNYYYPNEPTFVIENTVEAFDKIVVTLYETHLPQRRAKVERITMGVIREFDSKELTETNFIHEIDLISDTVPINIMDVSYHSATDAEFIFQKKQPVEAYIDGNLIGVYYVENGERTGNSNYSLSCHDAIGVLELDIYNGGIWFDDTPIETILTDIVGGAFDFEISEELQGAKLKGHIPKCKKREALQQLAFALGCCIDTSGTQKIKLFLPSVINSAEIPQKETYEGGKVATNDIVTAVSVIGYDIYNAQPSEDEESIEHNGEKYRCVPYIATSTNPNVTAGTLENTLTFESFLINSATAQARSDALLNYYMRRNVYSFTHVYSGQKLGEKSSVYLPWDKMTQGHIKKMTIKVSGIIASDTEMLLD